MGYEYKESIKDAVNEVYSASFADDMNRKNELDKVYRKAEAFDEIESIHLNMFGDTVRVITMEEAENFGMSVMRVLKIGEGTE